MVSGGKFPHYIGNDNQDFHISQKQGCCHALYGLKPSSMLHFWPHLQVPKLNVLKAVQTLNHIHVQVTCPQNRRGENVTQGVLKDLGQLRLASD